MIDYCRQLFAVLEQLEQLLSRADHLKQDYLRRVNQQIERQATFLSIIVSGAIIVWFMLVGSGMFGNLMRESGVLEVFIRMFAITFIAFVIGGGVRIASQWLWNKDYLPFGKKMLTHLFLRNLRHDLTRISQETQGILVLPILQDVPLPEQFLNTKSVAYISNCLERHEAENLSEAVNLLVLESREQQVEDLVSSHENVVLKAEEMVQEIRATN